MCDKNQGIEVVLPAKYCIKEPDTEASNHKALHVILGIVISVCIILFVIVVIALIILLIASIITYKKRGSIKAIFTRKINTHLPLEEVEEIETDNL